MMTSASGLLVTKDIEDALVRLWSAAFVIITIATLLAVWGVLDAVRPAAPDVAEEEPANRVFGALWGAVMIAFVAYQVWKFIWRPVQVIAQVGLSDADRRLILLCVAQTALLPALGMVVLASPLAAEVPSRWLWLLLIPGLFYWEWIEARRAQFVELAIGRAGFVA